MKCLKRGIFAGWLALLLVGTVTLTSCGGGGGSSSPPPPTTGTVRVTNNSTVPINEFYLAPVTDPLWGPNQLSSSVTAGTSRDIVNVPAGAYDARAVAIRVESTYYAYRSDFIVTAGGTFTVTATNTGFTGSMKITNNTVGANITHLYVSPTSSDFWGPNQITSDILPNGSRHLTDMPSDNYDVLVVWSIGPDSTYTRSVSSLSLTTLLVN